MAVSYGDKYIIKSSIKDGTANLSCVAASSIYGVAAFYKMKIHSATQEQNKVQPFPEQPLHSPESSH